MLRFVPNDTHGMPQRRSGLARACEVCRRRKKRCDHSSDSTVSPESPEVQQQGRGSSKRARLSVPLDSSPRLGNSAAQVPPTTYGAEQNQHETLQEGHDLSGPAALQGVADVNPDGAAERPNTVAGPRPGIYDMEDSRNESRFIGHLNPEGTFLVATSPANNTVSGRPEEVGIWLSTRNQSERPEQHQSFLTTKAHAMYSPNPLVADLLLPHLEDSRLTLLPNSSDFDALRNIYFDEFHPMFPILEEQHLEALPSQTYPRVTLRQIVCLIASSSSTAEPYLSLQTNQVRTKLTRSNFARQLSLAVRTALSLELIKDKLTLCQICALFSMYTQLADDRHLSVELCARAVAHAQTLGLHLPSRAEQQDTEICKRVFCCIWTLDRLNAAFQGRPVTMHERDIGIDLQATFSSQESCFRLFLQITLLLDRVIDLYRPKADGAEADWGSDFPDFESIVNDAEALRVKHNLLATAEIFYHAVAMLSCRSQSLHQPLRQSASYLRQSLSAHRALLIVSEELKPKLSPIPVVPYAVSLALRFFYREFRYTKVPLHRTRAQKQLTLGCSILEDLGEAFPAAAGIANLVRQTLKETEKVYSSLAQPEEAEGARATRETETNAVPESSNLESDADQQLISESTRDELTWNTFTWDDIPDIDVFQHFDPNFNLGAIDAALADDTQPVFPITFDNLWS